jgi:hypothetical protein
MNFLLYGLPTQGMLYPGLWSRLTPNVFSCVDKEFLCYVKIFIVHKMYYIYVWTSWNLACNSLVHLVTVSPEHQQCILSLCDAIARNRIHMCTFSFHCDPTFQQTVHSPSSGWTRQMSGSICRSRRRSDHSCFSQWPQIPWLHPCGGNHWLS